MEEEDGSHEEREKRKCLVWLIAVIVGGSTAHPADLTELLTLFSSENFECGSICIDKRVVFVFILIIGPLRIGMK
jgi:hypothetical protein